MGNSTTTRSNDTPRREYTIGRDEPASVAVIEAIADASDTPVTELPPLYEAIDTDALDTLCSTSQCTVSLTIEYDDYLVYITGDGRISLYERTERITPV